MDCYESSITKEFEMQLLIIKVIMSSNDHLNRIGPLKYKKKKLDFICNGLDSVSWTIHESSIIKKSLRCS